MNFTDIDIKFFNKTKQSNNLQTLIKESEIFKAQTKKDFSFLDCQNFLIISASNVCNDIKNDISILDKQKFIMKDDQGIKIDVKNIKNIDKNLYKHNFFL